MAASQIIHFTVNREQIQTLQDNVANQRFSKVVYTLKSSSSKIFWMVNGSGFLIGFSSEPFLKRKALFQKDEPF